MRLLQSQVHRSGDFLPLRSRRLCLRRPSLRFCKLSILLLVYELVSCYCPRFSSTNVRKKNTDKLIVRCVCYLVLRKSLIYLLVLTPIRFSSDFRIHCRLRRLSSSSQSFHHPCLYPFIFPPYFSPSETPTQPHILPFTPSQKR